MAESGGGADQKPLARSGLARGLSRAASTFILGQRGLKERKNSFWRPEPDSTKPEQSADDSSSEDEDEPWWLQDELWDVEVELPDYAPPSYDQTQAQKQYLDQQINKLQATATGGANANGSINPETPELYPSPRFNSNIATGPQQTNNDFNVAEMGIRRKASSDTLTKKSQDSYKGKGRGRGRMRALQKDPGSSIGDMLGSQYKNSATGDDYGRGPIGRAKTATLRRKPPTEKPKVKRMSKPYFTATVSILNIIMMVWVLVLGGGFVPFAQNPFLGPDTAVLVVMGGKYVEWIRERGEWWRLITAMYLHSGLAHLAFNLLAQIKIGAHLERVHGTFRLFPIYVLSGIYGNIISAIFLPQSVTVGASGAIYGFFGVLLVDLIKNWGKIPGPCKQYIGLCIGIVISFAIGLLPGVDNWAHLGGFIMGILSGIVFLPSMHIGKWNVGRRIFQICLSVSVMLAAFIGTTVALYQGANANQFCGEPCKYVTCLPFFDACKGLSGDTPAPPPTTPPA